MFGVLTAMDWIHVHNRADALGIEADEQGASVLPDSYSVDERGIGENAAKPSEHRIPIK